MASSVSVHRRHDALMRKLAAVRIISQTLNGTRGHYDSIASRLSAVTNIAAVTTQSPHNSLLKAKIDSATELAKLESVASQLIMAEAEAQVKISGHIKRFEVASLVVSDLNRLPETILSHVISYLSLDEILYNCYMVSHQWSAACRLPSSFVTLTRLGLFQRRTIVTLVPRWDMSHVTCMSIVDQPVADAISVTWLYQYLNVVTRQGQNGGHPQRLQRLRLQFAPHSSSIIGGDIHAAVITLISQISSLRVLHLEHVNVDVSLILSDSYLRATWPYLHDITIGINESNKQFLETTPQDVLTSSIALPSKLIVIAPQIRALKLMVLNPSGVATAVSRLQLRLSFINATSLE
jgi:hypothetical protein